MSDLECHTLVIGAGPGGYVCAIRAAQLGLDTVIVEARREGGTCLNVGCIPSKALIHAADVFDQASVNHQGSELGIKHAKPRLQIKQTIAWKNGIVERLTHGVNGLLNKNEVRIVRGTAEFVDGKTVDVRGKDDCVRVTAKNIVIATGSQPVDLPGLRFGGNVWSSTDILATTELPENLVVIGAGYIGLELGIAFAKLGSRVSIIESGGRILPRYDSKLTRPVASRLDALGVTLHTGTQAEAFDDAKSVLRVKAESGKSEEISADKVLVTVGRNPVTEGWGRENLVLEMDGRFIRIDGACRTSMQGIYAIGDVTGEPMLAHRAMAQGEMVAEILAGSDRTWDKRAIPAICFTDPEIVTAGLLPEEAREKGLEILVSEFPFLANGRAMTMERDDGFVRIVSLKSNSLIIGMQAVGHGVSELSSGFGLALEMGATLDDLAGTVHAHPTLGEALQETALKGLGHALHI